MKKCPKCNAEIQENARFCLYCMTSFEEKEEIGVTQNTKKSSVFKVCIILLAIILLSVVLGYVWLNVGDDSENVSDFSTIDGDFGNNSEILHGSEYESFESAEVSEFENNSSDDNSNTSEDSSNGNNNTSEDSSNGNNNTSEDSSDENGNTSEDSSNGNNNTSEDSSNGNGNTSEDSSDENLSFEVTSEDEISEFISEDETSYSHPTPVEEEYFYGTSIGEVVLLGTYEQDNNLENGAEKIKWEIVDIQNGKALLLSKYSLDNKKFNESKELVAWENSTLQSWLNNDFYNNSFSESDKLNIQSVILSNDKKPYYEIADETDTSYKVFLLSNEDVEKYFLNTDDRMCFPTEYCVLSCDVDVEAYSGCSRWWIRSSIVDEELSAYVSEYGHWAKDSYDSYNGGFNSVRPALWVDLQYLKETITSPEKETDKNTEIEITLSNVKKGDVISFGKYEQDAIIINGKENIEWEVLEVDNGKALLISKYALDCVCYNENNVEVTWESCTLRKWLNGNFYKYSFNDKEKALIQSTSLVNKDNPIYGTDGGNNTKDKIFVLSFDEAIKYFAPSEVGKEIDKSYLSTNGNASCDATKLAHLKQTQFFFEDNVWWLRTLGKNQNTASYVDDKGGIGLNGYTIFLEYITIRPAMWIKLP